MVPVVPGAAEAGEAGTLVDTADTEETDPVAVAAGLPWVGFSASDDAPEAAVLETDDGLEVFHGSDYQICSKMSIR